MSAEYALSRDEALGAALAHLQSALEILDRVNAPAQIGAYVDLARCQVLEALGRSSPDDSSSNLGSGDHVSRH
jgi:hypothetical protein